MRALQLLLETFDACAIVSTHSPIPLQGVPSACVRVLETFGRMPVVSDYPEQSFGAPLDEILGLAFRSARTNANYRHMIASLLDDRLTHERIEALIGGQLSFPVRVQLSSRQTEEGE